MTKDKPIQEGDVVQILSGYPFGSLVGARGVIERSLPSRMAVVKFQNPQRWQDPCTPEVYTADKWFVDWKYIKVLESAYGNSLGELEELLQQTEENLMMCRSCLEISEELRDMQQQHIQYLTEENEKLKSKIYSKGDK